MYILRIESLLEDAVERLIAVSPDVESLRELANNYFPDHPRINWDLNPDEGYFEMFDDVFDEEGFTDSMFTIKPIKLV